jgi:hypothetical protein
MRKIETNIVPDQQEGNSSGAIVKVECDSITDAIQLFHTAKVRLLSINKWSTYSGVLSGAFQLTDSTGVELNRTPRIHDLIRIDLPGPGPRAGDGYDWVAIEAMENKSDRESDEEVFAFRVRPTQSPLSDEKQSDHFYTSAATSSFIIQRKGKAVCASEEGRNEKPNTDTTNVLDNVRNVVVAFSASKGMSYPQWKSLMNGILKR